MRIISLDLSTLSFEQTTTTILQLATEKKGGYTCVANVHMCIEAWQDPSFASTVNGATIVTPDGMPLVKAMNWLYQTNQERVAGMDLLPALLGRLENMAIPCLFYGGTEEMLKHTQKYLQEHFPKLTNCHFESPPFRPLNETEKQAFIDFIAAKQIGLVFVALGCPKQEKFMAEMSPQINAHLIGIGGALPVMVGMQKRAPEWMQKNSLEWLYRLMQEPKRLFKRYFITNSLFILLFCKQLISQKLFKKHS